MLGYLLLHAKDAKYATSLIHLTLLLNFRLHVRIIVKESEVGTAKTRIKLALY